MVKNGEGNIVEALQYAAIGKLVLDYMGRLHPVVLQDAMDRRAIQTLEAVRCVLENDSLNDVECCERIENLIRLFYQELGIKINRHNELE